MQAVRMAMIGGGIGSFMGPAHRRAVRLDGSIALVGGAFSQDPERNARSAQEIGIDPERTHSDALTFLDREASLPADQRAELISIVTPNDTHAQLSAAALERGFAVFCEKPLARNLDEARGLAEMVRANPDRMAITYTYLGYPMLHEARALIADGRIGTLRRAAVSYTQGWLSEPVERQGNAQAAWRTNPAQSGASGCFGDIGVHAQSLLEFLTGDTIAEVMADLAITVPGRPLDDDGAVLLRMAGGARGTLVASQVCAGDQNRLEIALFGDAGSLRWAQENPSQFTVTDTQGRATTIAAGAGMMTNNAAIDAMRLPGGHPEGYIEALANLYRAFALRLRGMQEPGLIDLPSIETGIRSLAFVEAVLASSDSRAWTPVKI